jgi:ATP-dependent Clp protease protease subunit
MSTVVQAQLMFLDNVETRDITMHVDSPGGSVKSGLSIVDVMNYISSDISTINTGMAASMGSILLGNGTKGKRFSLKNSRVMLHQVSSGAQGHIKDMEISIAEAKKYNELLFTMLGDFCGKTKEQVIEDCNRDNWLNSEEALAYGIIDGVITKKRK